MSVQILIGDCRERMKELPDASVDSVVCDPPYHLTSIVKRFANASAEREQFAATNKTNAYKSLSRGFMGQTWDGGDVAFDPATWAEVLRVLKPGGHMVAFSGTRTYHRMVCAIEDAGFEIRDQLAWVYGSGFPKSLDVSKAIDKQRDDSGDAVVVARFIDVAMKAKGLGRRDLNRAIIGEDHAGGSAQQWTTTSTSGVVKPRVPSCEQWLALKLLLGLSDEMDMEVWRLNGRKGTPGEAWHQREVIGTKAYKVSDKSTWGVNSATGRFTLGEHEFNETAPATEAAQQWQGWGTALKPSWEPICLARRPLIGSVAANVLAHGTGALNIDGCRIEGTPRATHRENGNKVGNRSGATSYAIGEGHEYAPAAARWPANLCHDGSDEVLAGFPETGPSKAAPRGGVQRFDPSGDILAKRPKGGNGLRGIDDEGGSAARFFYCAKATTGERGEGNLHPTVKPKALMRWLCRLVTPKGGTILDPFMGSGSTGLAADAEQFNFIGCELSPEYAEIARKRIADQAGMFADIEMVHSVDARAA